MSYNPFYGENNVGRLLLYPGFCHGMDFRLLLLIYQYTTITSLTPILRATGSMESLDLGLCPKFIENSLPVLPGHGPIFLDPSMRESFWNGKRLFMFTTALPNMDPQFP